MNPSKFKNWLLEAIKDRTLTCDLLRQINFLSTAKQYDSPTFTFFIVPI